MYVSMAVHSTPEQRAAVAKIASSAGQAFLWFEDDDSLQCAIAGVKKEEQAAVTAVLRDTKGVDEVCLSDAPYVLCARRARSQSTIVRVGEVAIGAREVVLMAGPCAVESEAQLAAIARRAKNAGAKFLRGGAFKPRTSPYDFQGTHDQGLAWLARVGRSLGLKIVTEVLSEHDIERVAAASDVLQIGARNMQNFALLAAVGRQRKPVLLKRGLSATLREWLLAAEYLAAAGNPNIILCERGIRTFENATRNTLDLSAVPVLRSLTHLPVVVDPSHGTGRRDCIVPMAQAAIAAGADGLLVEAHPEPDQAWSDGPQSLNGEQLMQLGHALRRVAPAVDRQFA